jgi:hypothetical protein
MYMLVNPKKRETTIKVMESMKDYLRFIMLLALITFLCNGFVSATGTGTIAEDNITITHTVDGKILMSTSMYWIKIDPVSDIIAGQFTITGTTNLPVGSTIRGYLIIATDLCRQKTCNVDMSLYGNLSEVFIQSGVNSSNNTFSIPIYTKNLIYSNDYGLLIDSSIGSYGEAKIVFPEIVKEQIQSYNLPSSHSPDRYWIWINPLTNETTTHASIAGVNPHFQLTGTTNLPVGEDIAYSIIPYDYFDVRFPEKNWTISLIRNQGHVIPGKKTGSNSFTVDVDASQYCPGSYFVILWNPRYNSSDPNAFLAASTPFGFSENANLSTIPNCPTTPTYPLTTIINGSPITVSKVSSQIFTTTPTRLSTTTPLTVSGTLAALICSVCICVLVKKYRKRW